MSRSLCGNFISAPHSPKHPFIPPIPNIPFTSMSPTPSSTPQTEAFTWLQPGTWRKPCIVHVTMVAHGRQPLFGTLRHDGSAAIVEKTPVGWALVNQQRQMLTRCPEIKILADKVMPDHHHIVIQVQRTMPRSIKEVLRGFMQGCKAEARQLGMTENLYDGPPFYRVLTHKNQLHAMIEYVKANVERAWLCRQHPDLFRLHRHTTACGLSFTTMGNHFLLDWPDHQLVEMSRDATEAQILKRLEEVMAAAHNGAITITAAISKGEQTIARTIREKRFPLVILLNDGFPAEGSPQERFFKPGGVYFDACSEGRLLLMEPHTSAFTDPRVQEAVEATLQRKAETRHRTYTSLPTDTLRYRFTALNEIGRILASINDVYAPRCKIFSAKMMTNG